MSRTNETSTEPYRTNENKQVNRADEYFARFGRPDDWSRKFWAILKTLHWNSDDGVGWLEAIHEAAARGIDREWALREIGRRIRCGDVHLHEERIHPHGKRRYHADVLYGANQPTDGNTGHRGVATSLTERDATRLSLWRVLDRQAGRHGAGIDEVLARAERYGMDWLWVLEILREWTDSSRIETRGRRVLVVDEEEA